MQSRQDVETSGRLSFLRCLPVERGQPRRGHGPRRSRQDLIANYSASGRHCHGLKHIEDCLLALQAITDFLERDRAILIEAICWHDVVYDPTKPDDEEQSARLANDFSTDRGSTGSVHRQSA